MNVLKSLRIISGASLRGFTFQKFLYEFWETFGFRILLPQALIIYAYSTVDWAANREIYNVLSGYLLGMQGRLSGICIYCSDSPPPR